MSNPPRFTPCYDCGNMPPEADLCASCQANQQAILDLKEALAVQQALATKAQDEVVNVTEGNDWFRNRLEMEEAAVARLTAALEEYAEPLNWSCLPCHDFSDWWVGNDRDGCALAKDALDLESLVRRCP
jgi:hypothetical protein